MARQTITVGRDGATAEPGAVETALAQPRTGATGRSWHPVLVLAAHPDDETIGAGGLFSAAGSAAIILLTDGVPRDRRFWPPGITGTDDAYARLRWRELDGALEAAAVERSSIVSLGARDQEAAWAARDLALALRRILEQEQPGILITHPYEGGHPDHDTAALVARAAVSLLRRDRGAAPVLVEMTSYHARGDALETGRFLQAPGSPEVVRPLAPDVRERKERMLAEFASQRAVLAPFEVGTERFRRAPVHDFTAPPHPGALWYERLGFPMTGARWRALALDAWHRLGLGAQR